MKLWPEILASTSARHPWRTISAWAAVTVLAIAAVVTLLGLTTEGAPTNNPESERADEVRLAAFPPDPSRVVTDIVVIRSDEYTADAPEFQAYVRSIVEDREITALGRGRISRTQTLGSSRRIATRRSSRSRSSPTTKRMRSSRRSRRSTPKARSPWR